MKKNGEAGSTAYIRPDYKHPLNETMQENREHMKQGDVIHKLNEQSVHDHNQESHKYHHLCVHHSNQSLPWNDQCINNPPKEPVKCNPKQIDHCKDKAKCLDSCICVGEIPTDRIERMGENIHASEQKKVFTDTRIID